MFADFQPNKVRDADSVSSTINYEKDANQVTAEHVFEAFNWAVIKLDIPQPDFNCTMQLAKTLGEYHHDSEAIDKFQKAHAMDAKSWWPYGGLAHTYARQEKWDLATQNGELKLQLLREAEDSLKNRNSLYYAMMDLADWHGNLGNFDTSLHYYYQLLKEDPNNYTWILKLLQALAEQRKYSELTEQIQKLKTESDETSGFNRLITLYHTFAYDDLFHAIIFKAARETNNLDMVKEAYQQALDAAKEDSQQNSNESWVFCCLQHFQGQFLYRHAGHEGEVREAIRILEENMRFSSTEDSFREMTARTLSAVYLNWMRAAGSESPVAHTYLEKLVQLSQDTKVTIDGRTPTYAGEMGPKLMLGRYFRIIQREEDSRECFRDHIKMALDLLSDDDPENDWQGYQVLANVLMYYGDDANALAAWSLIGPLESGGDNQEEKDDSTRKAQLDGQEPAVRNAITNGDRLTDHVEGSGDLDQNPTLASLEETNVGSNAKGKNEVLAKSTDIKSRKGPFSYECDGGCGHEWSYADNLYVCKDCLDVKFNSDCLEKVRKGELGFNICSSKHEWLHVPQWDDDQHSLLGDKQVKVGETVRSIDEWLNSIRKEWGFPLPVKVAVVI